MIRSAPSPADYIDALVSGLATPEERERRPLMILQTGYFDDSGSDIGSRYYVLAGFLAPVELLLVLTQLRHKRHILL